MSTKAVRGKHEQVGCSRGNARSRPVFSVSVFPAAVAMMTVVSA